MLSTTPSAGPSTLQNKTANGGTPVEDDQEEEDDERMNLDTIRGFASKVQREPSDDGVEASSSRTKIVIPKRGEKDFEPLAETVNLQEMMLQRSREAMFGALTGVRGTNSKAMSHALLSPDSPYPKILVTRGHLLDTMGMAVRYPPIGSNKARTYIELLPEEALYLLERGSLQIWFGPCPKTPEEVEAGVGEWCEIDHGVKGAIEFSAMEGFASFIGQDDLTWERYQAYSFLKRLGYTVQRARDFLPSRFADAQRSAVVDRSTDLPPFRTWWLSIPYWIGLGLPYHLPSIVLKKTILRLVSPINSFIDLFRVQTSESLLATTRFVKTSPRTPHQSWGIESEQGTARNPYLPFWHVWRPATPWSKGNWDRGRAEGLIKQRPEYIVAVVNARDVPFPTLPQLSEVYSQLPDEPSGPIKKRGPQYERSKEKRSNLNQVRQNGIWSRIGALFIDSTKDKASNMASPGQAMGSLRNGDRALVVAVNDSGNTGWVRFGRTGFSDYPVF